MELSDALCIPTQSHTVTPRQQTQQELTDQLIKLVFQGRLNFSEIAKEIGIGRRRAYRLWNKWKQTEEAQMVDWEWWELYKKVKVVNPEKALECLTRIKHKMIVERAEVKQEIREISLKWDMPYEPKPSSEVQAAP